MKTTFGLLLTIVVLLSPFTIHNAQAMRWYSPSVGKWLSRDPIGEEGGANINEFSGNRPIDLYDYLGLAYGVRLTKSEAKQLACAINNWILDATIYNAVLLWGDSDRSLTLKFLGRYMSRSGASITVGFEDLSRDRGIQNANLDARQYFRNGGLGQYSRQTQTTGDRGTSINRVRIAYDKMASGKIKAYFPSERYTFSDTKPGENPNIPLDYLRFEGLTCCWDGGDTVSDKWMWDLEIYGYAKSFDVFSTWMINP